MPFFPSSEPFLTIQVVLCGGQDHRSKGQDSNQRFSHWLLVLPVLAQHVIGRKKGLGKLLWVWLTLNLSFSFPDSKTDAWPPRYHVDKQHYDIPGKHFIVLSATINHGFAERNLMIPLLAKNLESCSSDDDVHEVFLRTASEVNKTNSHQVVEYRSSMRQKINLKKVFKRTST